MCFLIHILTNIVTCDLNIFPAIFWQTKTTTWCKLSRHFFWRIFHFSDKTVPPKKLRVTESEHLHNFQLQNWKQRAETRREKLRRAEMSWERLGKRWKERKRGWRWKEVRGRGNKSWKNARIAKRVEKSGEELRKVEKGWTDLRRGDARWEEVREYMRKVEKRSRRFGKRWQEVREEVKNELRKVKKCWEELRGVQKSWEELRTVVNTWEKARWEGLRSVEHIWEEKRREKKKEQRWEEKRRRVETE